MILISEIPKSTFPFLQFYTTMSISLPSYSILNLKTRLHPPFYLTTVKRHRFGFPSSLLSPPNRNYNAYFRQLLPRKHCGHLGAVQTRGGWWSLRGVEASDSSSGKPVTVWIALKRMWSLIGDDNWIFFLALGAMSVAAVSEISMPRILTASVFSASNGESAAFFRSSRMLILLLIISGICSGLRSCCFAIANTILVKRLSKVCMQLLFFRYQKRAAKLMQDFNACANNVAQETLSLLRTVWAYGTEGEELGRYKWWLDCTKAY